MDITEICRDSQKLFEKVLSCIQNVIIITDTEGHILFANPIVEKVIGFTPDELTGKNFSLLFTPEDLTCLFPNLLYITNKNRTFEGEIMLIRKNKSRFFAFMIVQPCFDSYDGEAAIIISIQDIDKQKQLEKAFKGTNLKDLEKIANGIAHKLRNSLVGIGGFVDRLYKTCRSTNKHDEYYNYIYNSLKTVESLVKKVELFTQLPKPYFNEESIKELIEKTLQSYLQLIEEKGIKLIINVEEAIIYVDKELFIRALSIIIENSMDVLSEGGVIQIHSEKKSKQYKISITDNGSGISSKDLPYIFVPFFSTKPNGTGIDLAVVKKIVDSHTGYLEVKSKEGKGTTFNLHFPFERRRSIRTDLLEETSYKSQNAL